MNRGGGHRGGGHRGGGHRGGPRHHRPRHHRRGVRVGCCVPLIIFVGTIASIIAIAL